MIKFKTKVVGKLTDPAKLIDLDLVRERMADVARKRAAKFAVAMTKGLRDAAEYAEETLAVNDEVTKSFSSVKEDTAHVQFVVRDGPHSQVGDRTLTEVEVSVEKEPTPSKRDPEVVVQAFEFGSAAWNVPATAFSRRVIQEQRAEAKKDLQEVANVLE